MLLFVTNQAFLVRARVHLDDPAGGLQGPIYSYAGWLVNGAIYEVEPDIRFIALRLVTLHWMVNVSTRIPEWVRPLVLIIFALLRSTVSVRYNNPCLPARNSCYTVMGPQLYNQSRED